MPAPRSGTDPAPGSPTDHEVNFPPVQNGVDYLHSVADHLREDQPTSRDLKYAVLHLQAAAEVLLKARLQREHWSLVFKDPGLATRKKFEAGDFESCTTTGAVARLKDIADVTISDKSAKSLAILSKWRNALQHYGLKANARAVETRAAQVLDFLIAFVHEELVLTLNEEESNAIDLSLEDVSSKILTIKSLIQTRLDRLADELKDAQDRTLRCSEYDQWAVVIGKGNELVDCRFCHATWSGLGEAISFWAFAHRREDFGVDLGACPSCGEETLVLNGLRVRAAPEDDRILCGSCGNHFDAVEICDSCSDPYEPAEDDLGMCGDCIGARYAKF
ncbi:hypothetical protein [Streptomyces sp. PSKA30]|uniref:hypothetical protein n=1 Tax=Streptomyces sp. PSKA30 TaxID=2874597 RepID=UPI001CD08540|nr:hypothetical protein [Streptomyces sp. PSKA30]MBZ9644494.1 hypothetical protein [Streptomyces sp. PSKA30]